MKKLRDFLIVVVFGGIVVVAVTYFVAEVQHESLATNITIQKAEAACQEDGMICHLGKDMFSTVESAQAYLDSPEHLEKQRIRDQKSNGSNDLEIGH